MTMPTPPSRRGFTLVELMLVVAIVGILASIAMPKFADLLRKSSEGAAKGNLGAVRSALTIYYADKEGQYPATLAALTLGGKYLAAVPRTKTPHYHADSVSEVLLSAAPAPTDAGGWYYHDAPAGANYGSALVNCTHTDTRGGAWTSY